MEENAQNTSKINRLMERVWNRLGFGMRGKLIIIFLLVKVIPLILITVISWYQIIALGNVLKEIAVKDASDALNDSAVENIERMTTDAADEVASFLYERDDDILYLADINKGESEFNEFLTSKTGRVVEQGEWELSKDEKSWIQTDKKGSKAKDISSSNKENEDMDGFRYRKPDDYSFKDIPLYDEITYVDTDGNEIVKAVSGESPKINFPMSNDKKNISDNKNTYVKSEKYFDHLKKLEPGEIYVSDVIGAYVGSNYIGMYTPESIKEAEKERGYDIPFKPGEQSYAGKENPNGQRFEGIVRWATPVSDSNGNITGYVTMALNHDHIMEYVDHLTPMNERYTSVPSAYEGNYAFIWDYNCRNICHPRHNSIVGYDPQTGDPEVPWLETSIYEGWKKSSTEKWTDYVKDIEEFDNQSREKTPAAKLTKDGFVGLDGRYLNNAPQCTGWMDLTQDGGSGSFYILWSGLYKLTTAASIPYYTGQYAPSEDNDFSKRGFGIVTIGAGLDDFTAPATEMEKRLGSAVSTNISDTSIKLIITTGILIILVVFIAIWMASFLTGNITQLIKGISRFRAGERQFRFNAPVKDEFGMLADSFDEMADSVVDSVKNPLTIIDNNFNVIYMNKPALDIVEKDLSQVKGASYSDMSIYPVNTKYDPIEALKKGSSAEVYYIEDRDWFIQGTASYIRDKDNSTKGYQIITANLTKMLKEQNELRKTQEELKEAVKNANQANEHKSEFLARMSHEIRTPMNAIIGITSILQRKLGQDIEELKQEEVGGHINQIETSSQHLLGLLNDILEVSKIEAGKIDIVEEKVDLLRLLNIVVSINKPKCEEKNINFITDFDELSGPTFITDPLRLRQVLINLFGNAVKFTDNGGSITFTVKLLKRENGISSIKFAVKDTGIGISKAEQEAIFKPFERGRNDSIRQKGGTGLGLSISKNIVQLLGGHIEIKSEIGKGSEFYFQLDLKEADADSKTIHDTKDAAGVFKGKKILLVDDVEVNRLIIESLLEETEVEIVEAEDGIEAVEAIINSQSGEFNLILMDVQMPNMNGYEASSRIREMDREDTKIIPIIAITANAFKEDIDKAMTHGMNAHLSKPIEVEDLLNILFKYLN